MQADDFKTRERSQARASCLEALGSMDYFNATLIFKGALKELALYTMTD